MKALKKMSRPLAKQKEYLQSVNAASQGPTGRKDKAPLIKNGDGTPPRKARKSLNHVLAARKAEVEAFKGALADKERLCTTTD